MTTTSGQLARETDSALAFDAACEATGLFRMFSEVSGTLVQPRSVQRERGMRIDRILLPSDRLVAAGWERGIIGVELKRSGINLGPAIAQAIDYSRSVFTLPGGGFEIHLSYVFIWPCEKVHGDMASVLAQNRIGTASFNSWALLRLASGEQNILTVRHDRTFEIGRGTAGAKAGSR